jgi:RNA polymerase sigma-70 factor (ECF subfamily)
VSPNDEQRVKEGDIDAFEALFREHYASLCRFAIRFVSDPARAEDLVQSVFTTLWVNRETWAVEHSARAYLFAAVRNAALNDRRSQAVRKEWAQAEEAALQTERPDSPGADEILIRQETSTRLAQAIASLPERCRMVMELRWREQLSYAEIAEAMGISIKGVENQLARGIQRVRAIVR